MPKKMNDTQHRNLDKVQQRRRRAQMAGKASKQAEEVFRRPAYKKGSCN